MKRIQKTIKTAYLEENYEKLYQRDNAILQDKMKPNIIETQKQTETVSARYNFVSQTTTNNDIITGYLLTQMKDYTDKNCTYVPYIIPEDIRKDYANCKFLFYIFATDKFVCKRISKEIKTKLIWEPYVHQEKQDHAETSNLVGSN